MDIAFAFNEKQEKVNYPKEVSIYLVLVKEPINSSKPKSFSVRPSSYFTCCLLQHREACSSPVPRTLALGPVEAELCAYKVLHSPLLGLNPSSLG